MSIHGNYLVIGMMASSMEDGKSIIDQYGDVCSPFNVRCRDIYCSSLDPKPDPECPNAAYIREKGGKIAYGVDAMRLLTTLPEEWPRRYRRIFMHWVRQNDVSGKLGATMYKGSNHYLYNRFFEGASKLLDEDEGDIQLVLDSNQIESWLLGAPAFGLECVFKEPWIRNYEAALDGLVFGYRCIYRHMKELDSEKLETLKTKWREKNNSRERRFKQVAREMKHPIVESFTSSEEEGSDLGDQVEGSDSSSVSLFFSISKSR